MVPFFIYAALPVLIRPVSETAAPKTHSSINYNITFSLGEGRGFFIGFHKFVRDCQTSKKSSADHTFSHDRQSVSSLFHKM